MHFFCSLTVYKSFYIRAIIFTVVACCCDLLACRCPAGRSVLSVLSSLTVVCGDPGLLVTMGIRQRGRPWF